MLRLELATTNQGTALFLIRLAGWSQLTESQSTEQVQCTVVHVHVRGKSSIACSSVSGAPYSSTFFVLA